MKMTAVAMDGKFGENTLPVFKQNSLQKMVFFVKGINLKKLNYLIITLQQFAVFCDRILAICISAVNDFRDAEVLLLRAIILHAVPTKQ